MNLFDTHCHLDREELSINIEGVLDSAAEAGVKHILIPGCGAFNWEQVKEISQSRANLYYALGLHPYFIDKHNKNDLSELESRLQKGDPGCVAVGECGLDFFLSRDNEAIQKALLIEQIKLANTFELPLILHNRKAHQDLIKILRQYKPKCSGVIHGFSGSLQQANDFIDLGFYIGVGGTITYERASKTRKTISSIPLSSIVIETDSPDMPLNSYQGIPNHPKRSVDVLKSLNLLRNECEQTVASVVFDNSKRLFRICE
ncbi:TatD family hydrolase [Vibrio sp. HN007]|uniref:TatD family hydrolase n=1 Tax=Vibrio iocasae TaxID=3098914 RepID=UPI0035D4FA19